MPFKGAKSRITPIQNKTKTKAFHDIKKAIYTVSVLVLF